MTSFTARTARHFMTIKAARMIKKEIEKAGLEDLKILAENGVSIIATYLEGCSPKKQAELRRDFNGLLAMGVTPEVVLDAVAGQMPDLALIMKGREDYRKAELQKVREFLKGTQ